MHPDPFYRLIHDLGPKGHQFRSKSRKLKKFNCISFGLFLSHSCQTLCNSIHTRSLSKSTITGFYIDLIKQWVGVRSKTVKYKPVAYSSLITCSNNKGTISAGNSVEFFGNLHSPCFLQRVKKSKLIVWRDL